VTRVACVAAAALAVAAGGSAAHGATPGTKTYFVLGKQLVGMPVAAPTPRAVVAKLIAGPPARQGLLTFVPKSTRLRHASRSGSTATVDLSAVFGSGTPGSRTARLAQLVYTVSSVRGVRSVLVRIEGQTPAPAVFPHLDLSSPLTRSDIARPKVPVPSPPQPRLKPPSPAIKKLQQRLADLSFLPATDVDGRAGPETSFAVTAFQKWSGLGRDGVVGPSTMRALASAVRPTPITIGTGGRRIEVLLDRQLALLVQNNRVVLTIPVSTGRGVANATPPGSFQIFRKEVKSWSYPFQEWLPWASYFNGGIAFHEYPDVPTQAASHGCVRVPQYWSQLLYRFAPIGTAVRVLTRSLSVR